MELGPNIVASWKGRIGQMLVVATITGVVGLSAAQSASRTADSRPMSRSHPGHRAIAFNAPGPTTGSSTSSPTGQSHTSGTKATAGTTGVTTTTTMDMDMANMPAMDMSGPPPTTVDSSSATTSPSQPSRTNPPTSTTHASTNVTTTPSTPSPQPSTQPSAGTTNRNGGTFCNGWIHRVPAATNLTLFDTTSDRTPTAGDCANAHNFYNAVLASTAQFSNINIAIAAGYRPGSDAPGTITRHYVYWKGRSTTADPNQPQGLMYKFDAAGHATFLGAYYFANAGSALPQPAGPLTVWHSHMPNALRMLHIWAFPGVRDPFALMLSGA